MPHIWIDIETIPGKHKPNPNDIAPPANYKDPAKIEAYQLAAAEEQHRKQSLDSIQGQILCLSYAIGAGEPKCYGIWDYTEREILEFLDRTVGGWSADDGASIHWCGFNLHSFDLKWIFHRAVKYGLDNLLDNIKRDRYPKNVLDVREAWTGGETYGKGKMKDIAKFLGLQILNVDGSDVYDLYQAGEYDKITAYCNRDVSISREIGILSIGSLAGSPIYSNLEIHRANDAPALEQEISPTTAPVSEPA